MRRGPRCTKSRTIAALVLASVLTLPVGAQDPRSLPRLHLADLQYEGAFRLPASTFGASSLNYSEGPIEVDAERDTILLVGHAHHQALSEFAIPGLDPSPVLSNLPMAAAPLQPFVQVLSRAPSGNPQSLDRIGGLEILRDASGQRQLLVNAYEYYDAPGDNTHTTMMLTDALDLAASPATGFHTFQGGAGHTSGWVSPIPVAWQSLLGGTHITGQSSGIPIISRTSVGPSAFSFDAADLLGTTVPQPIPTTKLLDFTLAEPLHADLSNSSGTNDLWTHLSRVVYGFVAPRSRTYVTLGYTGGHASGVCYKCTQNNGNTCGGYCAPDASDYDLYYWLWDVLDLLDVKDGTTPASAVRPYEYGVLPSLHATSQIGGGSFDPASGLLYLSMQRADREQGTYSNPPVIVVFRVPSDPDVGALFADGFESGDVSSWG